MTDVHVLDVLLHDDPVGTLTRVSDDRTLFPFNDSYIEIRQGSWSVWGSRTASVDRLPGSRPPGRGLYLFFGNYLVDSCFLSI